MKNFAVSLQNKNKIAVLFVAAALLVSASAAMGVFCGSVKVSAGDVIGAVFGKCDGIGERIVLYVRLPRTLASLTVGASLAVSGALIQGVFDNRLASPGIIGVNAGAGLAVTVCCALGVLGGWQMSALSFVGAFAATLVICLGAQAWGVSKGTLILLGVAMNSILGALCDTVIALKPELSVLSSDFKIGDFSGVTYEKVIPVTIISMLVIAVLMLMTHELDLLKLGDECASGLGMRTWVFRLIFLTLAALLAGSAVSIAGLLSFVGLVVPNAVRGLGVTKSSHLIPLCALFGGGFAGACDVAARSLFSPYEIPVGIIMAVVGAPVFVIILIKGRRV